MNEFTKEELEMIYLDMNYNVLKHGVLNVADEYLDLRDKVKFMIDNYHGHDRTLSVDDDGHYQITCGKCKEVLWNEE